MNKGRKVAGDVIINIFATLICTVVLNIVVYPTFARRFAADEYGDILTAIGVINVLFSSLGNTLNNVRLILNKDESFDNSTGGYNIILLFLATLGALVGTLIITNSFHLSALNTLMLALSLFFGISRAYYIVEYRLTLAYKKQLVSNIFVATGYLLGIFVAKKLEYWPLPFLLGEFSALLYAIRNSLLFMETTWTRNGLKLVVVTFIPLLLDSFLGNLLAYLDRFLINPLLGAESVSTYTTAAFWGKCLGPFIAPTANVMLSYLTQKGSKISIKKYHILFVLPNIVILLVFAVGLFGAPILTRILYPTLAEKALPYMTWANLAVLLGFGVLLINPIIISICTTKELLVLGILQFVLYTIGSVIGIKAGGLYGFCVAAVIINLIKMMIKFGYGQKKLKKK